MGLFGKKEPTWYQQEAARIQQAMMTVAPGSNEYKELMDRLTSLREFAGKEKEMNQNTHIEFSHHLLVGVG